MDVLSVLETKIRKKNYLPKERYERLLDYLRLEKSSLETQDISELLDISIPTTYKLIDLMEKDRCLIRGKSKVTINSEYYTIIGISIGTTLCKVSFIDFSYQRFNNDRFYAHKIALYKKVKTIIEEQNKEDELLEKCIDEKEAREYLFFHTPEDFKTLKNILNQIFDYIKTQSESEKLHVISIGISCTGLINNQIEMIMESNNLRYLEHCGLDTLMYPDKRDFFAKEDIHVCLLQNCDASAIAEKVYLFSTNNKNRYRNHRNDHNIITLYLEYGIGAGLYLNQLYSGANGYSGEIGHFSAPIHSDLEDKIIREQNIVINKTDCCTCGNTDCFDFKIRKYCFNNIAESMKKDFKDCSAREINTFLKEHPDNAKLLGEYLGDIVNILTGLMDVDAIIFTGKIAKSEECLQNAIANIQDQSKLRYSRNDCTLIFSEIASSAPSIGAALYSYKHKYHLEYKWEAE